MINNLEQKTEWRQDPHGHYWKLASTQEEHGCATDSDDCAIGCNGLSSGGRSRSDELRHAPTAVDNGNEAGLSRCGYGRHGRRKGVKDHPATSQGIGHSDTCMPSKRRKFETGLQSQ